MRTIIRRALATLALGLSLAGVVLTVQGFIPAEHPEQPPTAPVAPTPTPEGPVESV